MIGLRMMILLALLFVGSSVTAETMLIEAGRDTTLIEDPNGALGNGSGPTFFVGRTGQAQNGVRRGLLYFDVAAALPDNAIVESAALTLYTLPGRSNLREIRVHRLLADWGEGASYASGGSGDLSAPGDATWIHTFYDDEFWVMSGGHFVQRASASQDVGASGFYTWDSTARLAQDVRVWHAAPHRNLGWILLGNETTTRTVKNLASREHPDPSFRPVLEVTYRLPGD
jgi:hypothetical protein